MDNDFLLHCFIIAFFAGVQSIFGMGILVFGTPTFLLLGFSFTETLGLVLPASLLVSISQVISHKGQRPPISKSLYVFCIPAISLSLFITMSSELIRHVYILVAVALIISVAARTSSHIQSIIKNLISKNLKVFHIIVGIFHGMTNMGGALLAIMAVTIHKDKFNARYMIAVYYMTFVVMQTAVILLADGITIFYEGLILSPISIMVYFIFGNSIFNVMNNVIFQFGMNLFLVLYAVVLMAKWMNLI